ncbi:cysteine ABC transporter substrate-binding protein [Izhakiella australiensis]|uniref:Cysteine ABC transporter substrate-binding protein n=1 Tax=Izhakiella australiensis TaxID=1926881 RepID=A0A1S8YSR9_9GAMM|nr:transporter substrate-binding domain-containing protein [Izhakiella australiensis]OON42134.1 cysteine ABC transporter substrate-binding protein [Izhakiella australiensis]
MKTQLRFMALTLSAVLSLSSVAFAADNSLADIRAKGEIRIANTQASPPWSFINDRDQPDGYDVAMAKEVAKRIGIARVTFIADTFKNFVEGLKTDKYDLVMNDLTPTPEREKQVDFSEPYGVEEFRIYVLNSNEDIHQQSDLDGKKVGATAGTTNESWSREHLTKSDILAYDNGGLVFNDLANGRIDVVISSYFGGERYKKANNLPIKAVGQPLTYQLSAAALPKGHDSLKAAIDQAIQAMIADGTVSKLSQKYIGPDYQMVADIVKAKAEVK